jgi:hypothetical protein
MHLHVHVHSDSHVDEYSQDFKVEKPDDRELVSRSIASWVKRTLGEVPFRNSGSRYVLTINAEWANSPAVTNGAAPANRKRAGKQKVRE